MFVINKWQRDCYSIYNEVQEEGLSETVVLETKLIVKIEKDLWVYLHSLEGEDVGSVIFMVFGFHSISMPHPELIF